MVLIQVAKVVLLPVLGELFYNLVHHSSTERAFLLHLVKLFGDCVEVGLQLVDMPFHFGNHRLHICIPVQTKVQISICR